MRSRSVFLKIETLKPYHSRFERARRKQFRGATSQTSTLKEPVSTLFPSGNRLQAVEIGERVPVVAWGCAVPTFAPRYSGVLMICTLFHLRIPSIETREPTIRDPRGSETSVNPLVDSMSFDPIIREISVIPYSRVKSARIAHKFGFLPYSTI